MVRCLAIGFAYSGEMKCADATSDACCNYTNVAAWLENVECERLKFKRMPEWDRTPCYNIRTHSTITVSVSMNNTGCVTRGWHLRFPLSHLFTSELSRINDSFVGVSNMEIRTPLATV